MRPMSTVTSPITAALIAARKAVGMTQRDLAAALGLSPQYVNDVEKGRNELAAIHYGKLPNGIREAVVDAAVSSLLDQAEAIGKLR